MRNTVFLLICGVTMALTTRPAIGGPITFTFGGQVTQVIDDNNLLGGAVTVGTEFSGSYTFESTTPDNLPSPANGGFPDTVTAILGEIGGLPFASNWGSIIIVNDGAIPARDSYSLASRVAFVSQFLSFSLRLSDETATAFADDTLPSLPPNLESFQHAVLQISNEGIPLAVSGTLTSLVPEPGMLTLFGIGCAVMTACCRARRSRRRNQRRKNATNSSALSVAVLATSLVLGLTTYARADDCNDNGIEDAAELLECPTIDVVFVLDTSGSVGPGGITEVCNLVNGPGGVVPALADGQQAINVQILAIAPGGEVCQILELGDCCTDSVRGLYGTIAEGLPEELADCGFPEPQDGPQEYWGPATAIVAANKPDWGDGPRIVVVFSDEGPRCGSTPLNDPGEDRDAIDNAIPIVAANRVIIGAVVDGQGIRNLAQALADGGEPGGRSAWTQEQSPTTSEPRETGRRHA